MASSPTIVGGIAKLTIDAFVDRACTKPSGDDPIAVLINPESYQQSFGLVFGGDKASGNPGGNDVVSRAKSETMVFQLVLDGTGAVPGLPQKSVAEQIEALRRMGLTIRKGQVNFLVLSWGTLRFTCRLEALDVTYTLFNPDGSPLRAKVTASFRGVGGDADFVAPPKPPKQAGSYILVEGGETLDQLCKSVYGSASHVLDVASANQLDSIRSLQAGEYLYFPAFAPAPAA